MGLVAPVAAVLGAAIPTIVDAFTRRLPRPAPCFRICARRNRSLANFAQRKKRSSEMTDKSDTRPQRLGTGRARRMRLRRILSLHSPRRSKARATLDCRLFALRFLARHAGLRRLRPPVSCDPAIRRGIAIVAGILDITGSVVFIRASSTRTPRHAPSSSVRSIRP